MAKTLWDSINNLKETIDKSLIEISEFEENLYVINKKLRGVVADISSLPPAELSARRREEIIKKIHYIIEDIENLQSKLL